MGGIAPEVLAQRRIERIHRSVAGTDIVEGFASDFQPHDRLGNGDELAHRIVPALDHDAETVHGEIGRHLAERAARQQFE